MHGLDVLKRQLEPVLLFDEKEPTVMCNDMFLKHRCRLKTKPQSKNSVIHSGKTAYHRRIVCKFAKRQFWGSLFRLSSRFGDFHSVVQICELTFVG